MNINVSKNEIIHVRLDADPISFLVRLILLSVGILMIIPAPWVQSWFSRWLLDKVRFSDNTRTSFSGEGSQIWLPIMVNSMIVWCQIKAEFFGQYAAFILLISLPIIAYIQLIIARWFWSNVALSNGTKISFIGKYLPLLGWQFFLSIFSILFIISSFLPPLGWFVYSIVALVTIAVWAWGTVEFQRWYFRNLEAKNHQIEFHGDGWNFLWRTVVFALSCVLLIPIPWMTMWLIKWFVKNIAITKSVEINAAESIQSFEANLDVGATSTNVVTNDLWARALSEYESVNRNQSLWARLFSEIEGNETIVKANYLRIRVEEMQQAITADKVNQPVGVSNGKTVVIDNSITEKHGENRLNKSFMKQHWPWLAVVFTVLSILFYISKKNTELNNVTAIPPKLESQSKVAANAQLHAPAQSEKDTTKSIELGQAILHLMPEKGKSVGWDFQSESNIVNWTDSAIRTFLVQNGNSSTQRSGLIRIDVMGVHSTVLKNRKEELPWEVTFSSDENPKFGPKLISLEPKDCFGHLYTGCTFAVTESLSSAGIAWEKVCEYTDLRSQYQGYMLRYPSRVDTHLKVTDSGGSGGNSTALEIQVTKDLKTLCKP